MVSTLTPTEPRPPTVRRWRWLVPALLVIAWLALGFVG